MNTRRHVAAVSAALAMAVTGAVLAPAQVDAAGKVPTITATVSKQAIKLSRHSVQAGLVKFTVTTQSGDHTLQLFKLRKWYTPEKFQRDIGRAMQGKVLAVGRVDRGVIFAGGAEVKPKHPGRFVQELKAGTYYVMDQNGPAMTQLKVTGPAVARGAIATSSTIKGTGTDRFRAPSVIPAKGWTTFKDLSDEPHFMVMQHVRRGITRADIKRSLNSPDEPKWLRPGEASTGVISGGTQTVFHYNLPPGRYVLICWWPSDENGMPHAMMGMYRLITLR